MHFQYYQTEMKLKSIQNLDEQAEFRVRGELLLCGIDCLMFVASKIDRRPNKNTDADARAYLGE